MKKYRLASTEHRDTVDLQQFSSVIEEAVLDVLPQAIVHVYSDYYTITPEPDRGDAIRIGKKICKSDLGSYCISVRKLFCSEDFIPEED